MYIVFSRCSLREGIQYLSIPSALSELNKMNVSSFVDRTACPQSTLTMTCPKRKRTQHFSQVSLLKEVGSSDFIYCDGHMNEAVLCDTAKQLEVKSVGELQPCVGCSMGKRFRNIFPVGTKVEEMFVDLSRKKAIGSINGRH